MAGRLFTGITSGFTQGLTKGLFHKQEETDDHAFQDILSHLQQKQPQTTNLPSFGNEQIKPNPKVVQEKENNLKIEEQDLILDDEASGWGITDDILIEEPTQQHVDENPSIDSSSKEVAEDTKVKTPSKPSKNDNDSQQTFESTTTTEKNNMETSSRRKISNQFKQMGDKASDLTKKVAGSFLGKITKGDGGNTDEKKKGGDSSNHKSKAHDTFDFKDVFSRFMEPSSEHQRRGEIDHRKEGNVLGTEDHGKLKGQMQKYMIQANQLETLLQEERDLFYDEHLKKKREVEMLHVEATHRLEECEKREKELRLLDEKVKLKEHLNLDENYFEKVARENEENRQLISELEGKNKLLEFSIQNEKEEQEKVVHDLKEKMEILHQENQLALETQKRTLKNEYEKLHQEQEKNSHKALSQERNKYQQLVQRVKNWEFVFQNFKKSLKTSLWDIEEILGAKGEEFGDSTHLLKEFQEKFAQTIQGLKVKIDSKEDQITKYIEIEKGLKEEIKELQREKTKSTNGKDKEIKELKQKLNKIEENFEIEKGNLLLVQTKFDETLIKLQDSEQRAKTSEREKNDFRRALESEKKQLSNLQIKYDDLQKLEQENEEAIKSLQKSQVELKKEAEEMKKKYTKTQLKLDEEEKKRKTEFQLSRELEAAKEELEKALENEKLRNQTLENSLEKMNQNSQPADIQVSILEKEKKDLEERYIQEVKELKAQNYSAEESYLKEIEELKNEIEKLKIAAPKESKNVWRKSSGGESQKKVNELTDQIENLNKEKIKLGEKYQKDQNELIASHNERFKNLNTYVEQLYAKNHELTEEKKKMESMFNQLKEKVSSFQESTSKQQETSSSNAHMQDLFTHLDSLTVETSHLENQNQRRGKSEEKEEENISHEDVKNSANKKSDQLLNDHSEEERGLKHNSAQLKSPVQKIIKSNDEVFAQINPKVKSNQHSRSPQVESAESQKSKKASQIITPIITKDLQELKKEENTFLSANLKAPFMAGLSSLGKIVSAMATIPTGLKGSQIEEIEGKSGSNSNPGSPVDPNKFESDEKIQENNDSVFEETNTEKEIKHLEQRGVSSPFKLNSQKKEARGEKLSPQNVNGKEEEINKGWDVENIDFQTLVASPQKKQRSPEKKQDAESSKSSPIKIVSPVKVERISPSKTKMEQISPQKRKDSPQILEQETQENQGGWNVDDFADFDRQFAQEKESIKQEESPFKTNILSQKENPVGEKEKKSPLTPLKNPVKGNQNPWDADLEILETTNKSENVFDKPAADFTPPSQVQTQKKLLPDSQETPKDGGWGFDEDLNIENKVEESKPTTKISFNLRESKESKDENQSIVELKTSLDNSSQKPVPKTLILNKNSAVNLPQSLKSGSEEKKKGGFVVNKILLPKKGTTSTSKISLTKPKEENDDIDLEEFLGSSIK